MTREEVREEMQRLFEECQELRNAGQKEYAHDEDNAFANFERIAEKMGLDRRQVLMVYLEKHIDGIQADVSGYKSQREPVRGRIKDAIVYLALLACMDKEDTTTKVPACSYIIVSSLADENSSSLRSTELY